MVEHVCEKCEKVFKQKSQLDAHKKRKTPCKKNDTIEKIVERKVVELLDTLVPDVCVPTSTAPLRPCLLSSNGREESPMRFHRFCRTSLSSRHTSNPLWVGALCISTLHLWLPSLTMFTPTLLPYTEPLRPGRIRKSRRSWTQIRTTRRRTIAYGK